MGLPKRFKPKLPKIADESKSVTLRLKPRKSLANLVSPGLDRYDGRRKWDWDAIRLWFIETKEKVSYAEASRRFGPHYTQIRNKAIKERWSYLRAQHQAEVVKRAREEHTQWALGESRDFDKTALSTSKLGMAIVTTRLVEIQRMYTARRAEMDDIISRIEAGLPVQKHERWGAVDYREIESLARSLLAFQEIGRKALGTDVLSVDLNVEGTVNVEEVVHIGEQLTRDDPDRIAQLLEAAERTGLFQAFLGDHTKMSLDDGSIIDAEVADVVDVTEASEDEGGEEDG